MSKKLTLDRETLRLLSSTDPFEAIGTDQTGDIVGGMLEGSPTSALESDFVVRAPKNRPDPWL